MAELEVGEQTRELDDFNHEAETTDEFLNKPAQPQERPALTLKQKAGRLVAAAGVAFAGILAYKGGLLNSKDFEGKEPDQSQTQKIEDQKLGDIRQEITQQVK